MNEIATLGSDRLAVATGVVAAGSAVSLLAWFAVQGPFGTVNDIGNAATGVLSACLAWRLRGLLSERARGPAVASALLGAAVTVAGSGLVISGSTGFFQAGLVSSAGFAGIGAWLLVLGRSRGSAAAWPRGLRAMGVTAGGLMAIGLAGVPVIVLSLDDPATAPAWAWLAFTGWLGIYIVYPAWAIRLRSAGHRPALRPVAATARYL